MNRQDTKDRPNGHGPSSATQRSPLPPGAAPGKAAASARILVIDDDEAVLDSVSKMLSLAGHEVAVASDGDLGLDAYRRRPHDLVIVDIFMPRKSGMEVIQELRSEFPEVKIIVISGVDVRDGLDLDTLVRPYGIKQALQKPLRVQTLLDAVDRALEQP